MAVFVGSILDFGAARRITNLAPAAANGEAVVFEQLNAAVEGIAWKDDVVVSAQVDVTVASPGASIDGVSMVANDRVLLRAQTADEENGIYIWNGAAVPMTRSLDTSTFDELEGAVATVTEGTDAGVSFRQTQVNGAIGVDPVLWVSFGTAAPAASETTAGIAEIATQAETDTGTDDLRFVTPLKLATYAGGAKRYVTNIGDGASTSFVVTHNLGTLDVQVYVYENGGTKREVIVEKQHTSTNSVTIVFDAIAASNAYRVVVLA